jgi:hypothetical protein
MPGTIAKLEHQWHEFAHDKPGQRFENQHRRLKRGGKALLAGMTVVGALLVAGGVVLLFVPGPGLLVAVFGLALLAGTSSRLARVLDQMEPVVRRWASRAKAWWSQASITARVATCVIGAAIAGVAIYGAYRLWFT